MRTIDEIFKTMIAEKERHTELSRLTNASSASIWRLMLYIVAVIANTVEKLFDLHKSEIEELIKQLVPGRAEWYARKALDFLKDELLPDGSDIYDTTNLTDEEIENKKVVKYAVAVEDREMANLTLKIAGTQGDELVRLDDDTEAQFCEYMRQIKYAGVKINIINRDADLFSCIITVRYNPLLQPVTVSDNCIAAIENYLKNLPFNGEYSNMALVDIVQQVDGVKIIDLVEARSNTVKIDEMQVIESSICPLSGYFKVQTINNRKQITVNLTPYE